jgi:hypothetical protein
LTPSPDALLAASTFGVFMLAVALRSEIAAGVTEG